MQILQSLTPVSRCKRQWSMGSSVLSLPISLNDSVPIGSMMMADPLIHQHGQLQKVHLTFHWYSRCETVAIDIAESLSFRKKIVWVFEARSQFYND